MGKRVLFAVNPKAGKSNIRSCLMQILSLFAEHELVPTMLVSRRMGEIMETVTEKAGDYDMVVCCGGDGTLNETVNGVVNSEKDIPIGYIPTGTVNDFASTHKLSKDMMKAAATVVEGEAHRCDIGRFNGRLFTYVAAFGAFSDVSYQTSQKAKAAIGRLAYIFEGVKRIPKLKSFKIKVVVDGEVIEDEFIYGMVSNSVSVGGFKFFPHGNIDTNDGLLEVTLVKNPKNFGQTQKAAIALLRGAEDSPMIYRLQAKKVEFISEEEISWTVDGEAGGSYAKTEINVEPSRITIIEGKSE